MTVRSLAAAMAPFEDEGLRVRVHAAGRWLSCPFDRLIDEIRGDLHGRVLDFGCGHGLLTHRIASVAAPGTDVVGVDVDGDKIATARRSGNGGARGVTFAVCAPGQVPPGPWNAIVVVDVLYLLPDPARTDLLGQLAGMIADGGVLALKEMATEPALKAALMRVQEWLAVRVLRITEGDALAFTSAEHLGAALRRAGLDVETKRIDRGYPHPHQLVLARKRIPTPEAAQEKKYQRTK